MIKNKTALMKFASYLRNHQVEHSIEYYPASKTCGGIPEAITLIIESDDGSKNNRYFEVELRGAYTDGILISDPETLMISNSAVYYYGDNITYEKIMEKYLEYLND